MPVDSVITDISTERSARVSEYGQLVTAPLAFSKASVQNMAVVDTAYNFITPSPPSRIVITDIILYADKSVGAGDATIVLYANSIGPSDRTQTEVLLNVDLPKNATLALNGLNLTTTVTGSWVNGETNDNNVKGAIYYYYAEPL
jgi:hypothetical protein